MKQTKTIGLAGLILAIFPSISFAEEDSELLLDRVAAVVNGEVITLSEVQETAAPLLARLPEGIDAEAARAEALFGALDVLIDERLLRQEAVERDIRITEAEIDRAVVEVRRQHGLTDSQFREALQAQGLGWEEYRRQLATQLERYRLLGAEVQARVEVTDEDVRSYLARRGAGTATEEARVRHILLRVEDSSSEDQARERAEAILSRVRGGEDFGEVARESSEDPSAQAGGDLGWLRKGRMVQTLEDAVFGASEGEVVGPVRSPSGWHLIEVLERRTRRDEQDEMMEQGARQALVEEALERETQRFIEGLRNRAVIETRL